MGAAEATAVTAAARPTQPRRRGWFRRHLFEIALISPLVLYILVLTIAPILDTFRRSFSAPGVGFGPSRPEAITMAAVAVACGAAIEVPM